MHYYFDVIKKYAQFSGRARRKEYWMFALITFIITCIISAIDKTAGFNIAVGQEEIGILSLIYALALFLPSLALSVRRLHDINKSGWFILLGLIPFVGSIILLVFNCMAGTVGENKYGVDPKAQN